MRPAPISSMDVVRERRRAFSRPLMTAIGTAGLIAAAVAAVVSLVHSGTQGTSVDRATIVTDIVRRGTLERSIAAAGVLASQQVRIVAAAEPGIIESVFVKPGFVVSDGTPVARLSNPQLDADVASAQSAVRVAQAQLESVEEQARASALAQRSTVTTARAQAQEDATTLRSLQSLHRSGFIADQTYRIAQIKATSSASQLDVARLAVGVVDAEQQARIAAARAQVTQAKAALVAKQTEVRELVVRARSSGLVQSVAVDPGARIDAGTELARVADQRDLKAVLQVPEGQAHSVLLGMLVRIDTGNGIATGHVERIAPAAQNGSVAVDVAFTAPLPAGVRPDSNVDGTIELAALRNVVSIVRPAGATDNSTVWVYRIGASSLAHRVRVRLGRGSADRVVVLSGLHPGEHIIVSDTSAYNDSSVLHIR